MISGNPVYCDTSVTGRLASPNVFAVPPVERMRNRSSTSPRANSPIPFLSDTDRRANGAIFFIMYSSSHIGFQERKKRMIPPLLLNIGYCPENVKKQKTHQILFYKKNQGCHVSTTTLFK